MNYILKLRGVLLIIAVMIAHRGLSQTHLNTPNTESVLYLGEGENQPLIVGLGGSEGGNAWTSDYWAETRNRFIEKGYAFLAVGYFGAKGTPPILEKIALEDVHQAIVTAAGHVKVDQNRIAIIGGSRGADLALLLGSYYDDIKCVVGLVPSHAVFPGHTEHFSSSCWTFQGKELPFIPVSEEAVPSLIKGDLRGAFEAMLKDSNAEEKALIRVENTNGPILVISATRDEISPSTPMSEKIISRLKSHNFKHRFEHIAIEGGHAEPLKHFDQVFEFLDMNFAL